MTGTKTAAMGRPKKSEPTDNYRMRQSTAKMLRMLAVDADMDAADYFEAEFGAAVRAKYQTMLEKRAKESRESAD